MRRHYIVSYDISDPRRLRRVHRIVRDYGDALQYSVFACQLHAKDLAVLEAKLREVIHHGEDQVLIVDLGKVADDRGDEVPPRMRSLGCAIEMRGIRLVVV